jgi:mRNA-degrading endonuclease toxin of MazEF toxin-antitoxin module
MSCWTATLLSQRFGMRKSGNGSQFRVVDKARLVHKLGRISKSTQKEVLVTLAEMFAE